MAEHHPGYPFTPIAPAPRDGARNLDPRTLPDVVAAFDRLRPRGDYLAAAAADGVFPRHRYTSTAQGENRGFIHFQGIQRLRNGRYAIVTGGDVLQPAAHLFVIEMGTRYVRGPWGSNLLRSSDPDPADAVVNVVALGDAHWHGGGVSVFGDVAVLPLEGKDLLSRTVFVDLSDPLAARPLPFVIEGPSVKGGAAALTRLPNDHFLCAVYRDEAMPKKKPTGFFDFFLSNSTDISDGFAADPFAQVYYGDVEGREDRLPGYQTVQFLVEGDAADPATWSWFLAGTWNGSSMSPTFPGPDWADLHEITFDPAMLGPNPPPNPANPHLRLVRANRFFCSDCFGNFDAAAGFHVDEYGELILYSAYHWRYDGAILLSEFRETRPTDAPPITLVQDGWIDLFEHSKFAGRRLTILGTKDENIADYGRISVQGSTFDDIVSSARWQIPEGYVYRLYADARYGEDRGFLDLEGDGRVHEIANFKALRPGFNDRVSSSRYV